MTIKQDPDVLKLFRYVIRNMEDDLLSLVLLARHVLNVVI